MPVRKAVAFVDFDYPLLFIVAMLVVLGTIMVFSASVIMAEVRFQSPYLFVIKHIIWVAIGTAALLFFMHFDHRNLQGLARPLLIVAILGLIAVLIFGPEKGGAKRWLQWGILNFQPSELAKLSMVIVLADFLDRKKSKIKQWNGLVPILSILGLFCLLIGLEPDLGTPVILVGVTFSVLYIAGANMGHIAALMASCIPFIVFEIFRKPYRLKRVQSFLESWGDINSTSYQLNQSILALGSGGFLGKGLAQGQLKLLYLPEAHTDFIFPIIGEELGYVGSVSVIVLFLFLAWRGWLIGKNSNDYFGGILAIGLTLLIAFQALFNLSVACGLLPTKGLPLPFVSFGGTALVINLAEIGILLNISKRITTRQVIYARS